MGNQLLSKVLVVLRLRVLTLLTREEGRREEEVCSFLAFLEEKKGIPSSALEEWTLSTAEVADFSLLNSSADF